MGVDVRGKADVVVAVETAKEAVFDRWDRVGLKPRQSTGRLCGAP